MPLERGRLNKRKSGRVLDLPVKLIYQDGTECLFAMQCTYLLDLCATNLDHRKNHDREGKPFLFQKELARRAGPSASTVLELLKKTGPKRRPCVQMENVTEDMT